MKLSQKLARKCARLLVKVARRLSVWAETLNVYASKG